MVAAMHMSLVQQKAAALAKPTNGTKLPLAAFKAARSANRGMAVVRAATAAAAAPATGEIKSKTAELAINGEML